MTQVRFTVDNGGAGLQLATIAALIVPSDLEPRTMTDAPVPGREFWRAGRSAIPRHGWSGEERMPDMHLVALTHHTGRRLAEVGFLLILFAGVWLAAAQIPKFRLGTARTIVAGIALTLAGLLLLIATHWGHFG